MSSSENSHTVCISQSQAIQVDNIIMICANMYSLYAHTHVRTHTHTHTYTHTSYMICVNTCVRTHTFRDILHTFALVGHVGDMCANIMYHSPYACTHTHKQPPRHTSTNTRHTHTLPLGANNDTQFTCARST